MTARGSQSKYGDLIGQLKFLFILLYCIFICIEFYNLLIKVVLWIFLNLKKKNVNPIYFGLPWGEKYDKPLHFPFS